MPHSLAANRNLIVRGAISRRRKHRGGWRGSWSVVDQHANALEKAKSAVRALALSNTALLTSAMYIVAHPDDSLIFQSPDLLQNVQNKINVFTVQCDRG